MPGTLSAFFFFFFSSRRRHTRSLCDWSSDVCSSNLTLLQASVEGNHELFGAAVVNVPQTEDERLRSGLEQAANQSDHLVPWPYHIQTGCAATQNDQFDREL